MTSGRNLLKKDDASPYLIPDMRVSYITHAAVVLRKKMISSNYTSKFVLDVLFPYSIHIVKLMTVSPEGGMYVLS